MMQVLDFLSERARGFMLTMVTGAGAGLTEVVGEITETSPTLDPLQKSAVILTCVVAGMTIISYGYKFYNWCKQLRKKRI